MFAIRQAGAKGLGLFASRYIPRGTRILAERALLAINSNNSSILAAARRLPQVDLTALLQLSINGSRRSNVLGLLAAIWQSSPSNVPAIGQSRSILEIFYNNNFALSDKVGTQAVFPTVARINHSCVPNSQGNFHEGLGSFAVHATRDIPPEEEVTISYLHNGLGLRNTRQSSLQRGYGFHCDCELCAGSPQRRKESRERRSKLQTSLATFAKQQQQLLQHLAHDTESVTRELSLTQLVIKTHEQEGLAGRELASLYSAAAGLAMKLDDHRLATILGARGLELERDAVGDDSPFYVVSRLAFSQMSFREGKVLRNLPQDRTLDLSYSPWT